MNMLSGFFDIRKNSKDLFEGLYISKNKEICNNWQNQYPVLFLTFKSVDGLNFNNAMEKLKIVISDICVEHYYLLDSNKVNEVQKEFFKQIL